MNQKELQKEFDKTRAVPYKIPISLNEEDCCCTGKNRKLMELFSSNGYEVRWRVCSFRWSDLELPNTIASIPHENESTHAFIELFLNNHWITIDATWDPGLKNILPISYWDGVSDTKVCVPFMEIFTPEKSKKIMDTETVEIVEEDLYKNKKFYTAFNTYLETIRENNH